VHPVGSYCANLSQYSVHETLNLSPDIYSALSYFLKLVKATIMSDRLCWLKSVDDNLKTQPIEFWKYVSKLKRKSDGQIVTDSKLAFAFIGYSSTIKSAQKKFANLCYNRFFYNSGSKKYEKILDRLNLSPLHLRQSPLDALFLTNVFINFHEYNHLPFYPQHSRSTGTLYINQRPRYIHCILQQLAPLPDS
jgi:hypothetical protein